VLLSVLDRKWREHLYEMDYLKEGIGLRAMAQRDPLVEYQREGFDMFRGMLDGLKEESVGFLFNVAVEVAPAVAPSVVQEPVAVGAAQPSRAPAAQPLPTEQAPQSEPSAAPVAFRAKGLDANGVDEEQKQGMTYSGPDESGGTAVRAGGAGSSNGVANSAGTRRDRRADARKKVKGPKTPKRKG